MVVERIPTKIEPDHDSDAQSSETASDVSEPARADQDMPTDKGDRSTHVEDAPKRSLAMTLFRLVFQIALPLLVLFGAVKTFQYFKATKPTVVKRPALERTFSIKTVPVQFTTQQPMLKLFGKTVSGRKVELRALVAGEVTKVSDKMRDGAVIEAGALLLQIDPFEYRGSLTEAKAQIKEAKARLTELKASLSQEREGIKRDQQQLQLAMKDAERARPLVRRGTISQKTLDDRESTVLTRRQTLEQRQNNIAVWTAKIEQQDAALERLAWTQERAQRRLKDATLRAPFKASVDSVNAAVGKILSANDRVATLFDVNAVDVEFTLTDQQYGRIVSAEGSVLNREINVEWQVGDTPLVYTATIERVSAQINADAGGVRMFARIKDPSKPIRIRPGAFVQIGVPDRKFDKVAALPLTTLYDNNTVYVVDNDNRLQPRKVQIVGWDGERVFVRGDIKPGDKVMRTRLSTPVRGLKVTEPQRASS